MVVGNFSLTGQPRSKMIHLGAARLAATIAASIPMHVAAEGVYDQIFGLSPDNRVQQTVPVEVEFTLKDRFSTGWNRYNRHTDFRVDANLFDAELAVKDDMFIGYLGAQTTDPVRFTSSTLTRSVALGGGMRVWNNDQLRIDLAALLTQNKGTDLGYRVRVSGNELAYTYAADFRQSADGFGASGEGRYHVRGPVFVEGFGQWFNDTFKVGAGAGYAFFFNYNTVRVGAGPFYRAGDGNTFGLWASVSSVIPGSYEQSRVTEQAPVQRRDSSHVAMLDNHQTRRSDALYSLRGNDARRNDENHSDPSANLVAIGSYAHCIENRCMLEPETERRLQRAVGFAKQEGYQLVVTSTYRAVNYQQELFNQYGSSRACGPNFEDCPHVQGIAVDVTLKPLTNKNPELYMGCMGADCKGDVSYTPHNRGQRLLRDIMERAGFKGMNGEWWHYEKKQETITQK